MLKIYAQDFLSVGAQLTKVWDQCYNVLLDDREKNKEEEIEISKR